MTLDALRLRMMDSEAPEHASSAADIRGRELSRGLFGYRRRPVDELLREISEVIASIEAEKAALAERIPTLEADLARRRDLERLLRTTLISAERAADAVRVRAGAEADQILEDARGQARRLVAAAIAEREQIGIRSGEREKGLRTALAILEAELVGPGAEDLDEALLAQVRRAAE